MPRDAVNSDSRAPPRSISSAATKLTTSIRAPSTWEAWKHKICRQTWSTFVFCECYNKNNRIIVICGDTRSTTGIDLMWPKEASKEERLKQEE